MIANVACPAQVMEATYQVSSDIAGETREKLEVVVDELELMTAKSTGSQAAPNIPARQTVADLSDEYIPF